MPRLQLLALALTITMQGCSCDGADSTLDAEITDARAPIDDRQMPTTDGSPRDGATAMLSCGEVPAATFDPRTDYRAPAMTPAIVVSVASDDGPGSLRQALRDAAAGAIIGFDSALAGRSITLNSTLQLERSVTLDGSAAPGVTLDGQERGSILAYSSDTPIRLGFFALRFVNGRTTGAGGALNLNGDRVELEVGGCTFEGNGANEGGAIRVGYRRQPALIHDSVFIDNDGAVPGGDRAGFSGGAISSIGATLRVSRCRFENNRGPITGAVYAIHSDPRIEDSVFIANESTGTLGSGAFFADGGGPGDYGTDYTDPRNDIPGQITLLRTRFERNRGAGDDGGAVEAYAYPLDSVTFEDCVFFANRAAPGRAGAAFIHADRSVRVIRTAFVNNTATNTGGAIWADGDARYEFENVLFSGNAIEGDLGGALRLNVGERAVIRIASATFVDNVASDANGAIWMGGRRDARITNSIFANNTFRGGGQQVNFPVEDGGGNIEWPAPREAPTIPDAMHVDPRLDPLAEDASSYTRAPGAGSPAVDSAVARSPATDLRGATRDARPDIGAREVGAMCAP